jgi:hypothetical protein
MDVSKRSHSIKRVLSAAYRESITSASMNTHYEIRIKGHLDKSWADWFDSMVIRHDPNGETVLDGPLPDQAALHGLLNRLRDLGVQLISVNPIEEGPAQQEDADA